MLDKRDLLEIIDNIDLMGKPYYRVRNYSKDPGKRAQQIQIKDIIISFKKRIFPEEYVACVKQKKRSIRCQLDVQTQKELKQQKFARHVRQAGHMAGVVATGLLTKDMLAAFIQGDYKSVAINSAVLLSSRLLGKLSNAMLATGEKLTTAETALLGKELALENKVAINIFLNKDVILPVKRLFLGKLLKTASPFVARGTSIFFAYTLAEDIKAYQSGDSDRLSSIISNSAIVAIDGAEMGIEGAEALELLTSVSAVTGPAGEVLTVLIWLSSEIYEVNKGLNAIEQKVNLNLFEKYNEGLRLAFGLGPSAYIELKARNTQLIQSGLSFLR